MTASVRALVLVLIALLGAATAASLDEGPALEAPALPTTVSSGFAPLPAAGVDAAAALLAHSPFVPDRSPYARPTGAPEPAAPPLEVRLVAVFSAAGAPRATLLIGGAEVTVGVGDETLVGAVASIEADAVVFGGAEGRRVSFFD